MTFKDLKIAEPILKAMLKKNYQIPTAIQQKAIPIALLGNDILGIAQTGTGKTAAFAIPIIQQLIHSQNNLRKTEIRALIITPTRELAIQIQESFVEYSRFTNLRSTVIYGGVNQRSQVEKIKSGIDILIATPGRLLDLISQKIIQLSAVTCFVLDEADRMLDMGFIHDVKRILPLLPNQKQTMLFSASMPLAIADLSKSILKNPSIVEVAPVSSTSENVEQNLFFVEKSAKNELLVNLLLKKQYNSVLVFTRTKHGADKIRRILANKGIGCEAIHGNKGQNARQRTLENFKSGKIGVLIATDIVARGIDVSDLELVINYDLPDIPETYVHRIGRTGRAGKKGKSLSFCSSEDIVKVRNIQKLTGKILNECKIPV